MIDDRRAQLVIKEAGEFFRSNLNPGGFFVVMPDPEIPETQVPEKSLCGIDFRKGLFCNRKTIGKP